MSTALQLSSNNMINVCYKQEWLKQWSVTVWNVSKQTKPLQVSNLISNKSLGILEACRQILDTHNVKFMGL